MIIRDPSDVTPRLNLPFILPSQAQKHVTVNESLSLLDGLVHLSITQLNAETPPSEPRDGDMYMISGNPSGDWLGFADHVAIRSDGQWRFVRPHQGWTAWVEPLSALHVFQGGVWAPLAEHVNASQINAGDNGIFARRLLPGLNIISQSTTCVLSSAPVKTQETGAFIPSYHLLIGVKAVVNRQLLDGVTWSLGDGATVNKFATDIGPTIGAEALSFCDPPRVYWSKTPIILTTDELNSGGILDITIFSLSFANN